METSISFTSFSFAAWARVHLARSGYCPSPFPATREIARQDTDIRLQVRVVQHKQTRDLYALKYINKTKCVKMKAVANIIQERRLLEEVRSLPGFSVVRSGASYLRHPSSSRSTTLSL